MSTSLTTLKPLQIDFVSDVACPWCAIGLASLERALERVDGVKADIHFQPFELNPQMPPGGEDVTEHLTKKYGSTAAQQAEIRERIRQRGADVGFEFRKEGRGRIYNTFNAHRLLHWAGTQDEGKQHALKKALLSAYHGRAESMESDEVLLAAVAQVGLDVERARAILASDEFTAQVREQEQFYLNAGINSVPAVIFNGKYLVSGGQPPEVFEQAIRQLAAEAS